MANIAISDTICPTGVTGLDEIIGGGFPRNRMYLLQGEPGSGKTTLALQFLMSGVKAGETCLYITFSETKEEIMSVAQSHGWDLGGLHLFELSSLEDLLKPETQNTIFHPSEVELNQTTEAFIRKIEELKPTRVVFDSVSEMRLLSGNSLRYRRQILSLKSYFAGKKITVLLLDDLTAAQEDLHVQSIVHGVFAMEKIQPDFGGERRRFNVVKLRGVNFKGGKHDYVIHPGGIKLYPRLIAAEYGKVGLTGTVSSGIKELDDLLGGGLDRGTSNLFMGPAGSGKSTISSQYISAAAKRGEKVAVYLFEENMSSFIGRAEALKMGLTPHIKSGLVKIEKIDPAQLTPGEFSAMLQDAVDNNGVRVILIDSLNGYLHAMPQQEYLILQLHELLAFLSHRGVLTLMVLAQQGMMGAAMRSPVDLTYLTDTLLITRFFELRGAVKKAISVVKKRTGYHEDTIRQFSIDGNGIHVGPALENFQGVLTGVPKVLDGATKS